MKKEDIFLAALRQRMKPQETIESENIQININLNKKTNQKNKMYYLCKINFVLVNQNMIETEHQLSFLKNKKVIIPNNYQWIYSVDIEGETKNTSVEIEGIYNLLYISKNESIIGFLRNTNGELNNCYPARCSLQGDNIILAPLIGFSNLNNSNFTEFLQHHYISQENNLGLLSRKQINKIQYQDKIYKINQCILQSNNLYSFFYEINQ
jgi:hypothetical protein